jgi:hypothetical protein
VSAPLGPWTLAGLIAAWILIGTIVTLSFCRSARDADRDEQAAYDRQFDITKHIEE